MLRRSVWNLEVKDQDNVVNIRTSYKLHTVNNTTAHRNYVKKDTTLLTRNNFPKILILYSLSSFFKARHLKKSIVNIPGTRTEKLFLVLKEQNKRIFRLSHVYGNQKIL